MSCQRHLRRTPSALGRRRFRPGACIILLRRFVAGESRRQGLAGRADRPRKLIRAFRPLYGLSRECLLSG